MTTDFIINKQNTFYVNTEVRPILKIDKNIKVNATIFGIAYKWSDFLDQDLEYLAVRKPLNSNGKVLPNPS